MKTRAPMMLMPDNSRSAFPERQAACYRFFGLRLASEMPLSLFPLCTDQNMPADVTLEFGSVCDIPAETIWRSSFAAIVANGQAHIRMENVARCLLRDGKQLIIDPAATMQTLALEALLMGPIAGMILHQRGIFPLQASAVEIGGGVVALAGPPGRGKSALAAALCRQGATLFCDGVCALTLHEGAQVLASQGSNGLCLWPDMCSRFLEHKWTAVRRGSLRQMAKFHDRSLNARRLIAIMRLAPDRGDRRPGLRRLVGPAAMMPFTETVCQLALGGASGRDAAIFRDGMRLACAVPIFEIQRPLQRGRREEVADWIVDATRSL